MISPPLPGAQEVCAVEDDEQRILRGGQRAGEPRHGLLPDGLAVTLQRRDDGRLERLDPVERRRHVAQQDGRIVVAPIDRDPHVRPLVARRPLRQGVVFP